jgi:hypothetical protein
MRAAPRAVLPCQGEAIELTGVGFFAKFAVPHKAPRTEPKEISGGNVTIQVEGVEHAAGCVLLVRDGVISTLEGYTHGGESPERPVVISVPEPTPVVPNEPAESP